MTSLTKSTVHLLCARAGIARKEITEEAQKLVDLSKDPNVPQAVKDEAKKKLDDLIESFEERVTTRRLSEAKNGKNGKKH